MKKEKFKGMEIICKSNRKLLCYNRDDLGARYKIYCKYEGYTCFTYCNSFKTLGEAQAYFDKIFDGMED